MKLKTINTAQEFRQWIEAENGKLLCEIKSREPNTFNHGGRKYIALTPYYEGWDTQIYQIVRVKVQREEVMVDDPK